uniref:Uncharacterized protein n=1 Tax=Megaselia scalaris TaxID=36166 RepID=T1GDF5_MEGSC
MYSIPRKQITGINIHKINVIVCSICVIYTMFGGIKAVVWTDVVQGFIMLASVVVVASFGIYKVGGFQQSSYTRQINNKHKLRFNNKINSWNCLISGLFLATSHIGFSQSCVQRLVSLPSIEQAQKSIYYFGFGLAVVVGFCNFTGLIMFANYVDCDPVRAGVVQKQDQMLPFFVQQTVGNIVGMSGFFISSVFSASLSTLSANLNSLSGIIYFDYIKRNVKHTEEKANFIMKIIVCLTGIYCIFGGLVVERFHSLIEVCVTWTGVAFGCLFGVFMMGFFVPKVHSKATFIAIVTSLIITIGIIVTGKIYMYLINYKYYPLPTSVEKCDALNINATMILLENIPKADPFDIWKMSFVWYSVVGSLLVWIIGIPLSYLMAPNKDEISNINLYAPIVKRILMK